MVTSTQTREANKILQAALDEISSKFGLERVSADVRRYRNDAGLRVMAVSMYTASKAAPKTVTNESAPTSGALGRAMNQFGVASTTNRKGDILVEYKSSRPKYPFVYQSARGTRWKISVDQAQQRFGIA